MTAKSLMRTVPIISMLTLMLLFLVKLICAVATPPSFDEAYYIDWARKLSWGYLDHPPGVAFLSALGSTNDIFILSRLPAYVISVIAVIPLIRISRMIGLIEPIKILAVLLLFFGSVTGMAFGALTLPDTGLMFFWLIAIQELMRALSGQKHAWLTLGIAVGMGFLCKYIMILFLPVILLSIIHQQPYALKKPIVWLGLICFTITISPHLAWNVKHDWRSFRFQIQRGLQNSHDTSLESIVLPKKKASTSYEDMALASRLIDPLDVEEKQKRRSKSALERFFQRTGEYFIGAFLIWGLVGFYLLYLLVRRRFKLGLDHAPLVYAAAVPFVFFGAISLVTKTEGNWVSVYTCAAAPLIVLYLHLPLRVLLPTTLGNILIYSLLVIYLLFQVGPISARRALKESFGYRQLYERVSLSAAPPLFTERYQIAAQLNYYAKEQVAYQFPGFRRISQYTFEKSPSINKTFALVTESFPPPSFQRFNLESLFEFRKCADGRTQWRAAREDVDLPVCRNKQKVQTLFLANYRSNP